MSMMLRPDLRNDHLLLAAKNLSMNSRVNQAMQTASTISRASFSSPVGLPAWSLGSKAGSVFRQSAIVEIRMIVILNPATT